MFEIRYVTKEDRGIWFTFDEHMSESEFFRKVRDRRGYVICDGDEPVGVMRYNLFWDSVPFLTLIHLKELFQRRGFGRRAMESWENEMLRLGHQMVMTSTQVDEQAQHFYRKLGYQDRGALFLDGSPLEQPQEIFMIKIL